MAKERTLESTSTWAVAVICFVLVAISIVIEHIIHRTGSWLKKKKKPSLYEALDKIKADRIADICIPRSVGHSWHPCNYNGDDEQYDDPCLERGQVQLVSAYGIHQLHIFIFVLAVSHVLYCVITYGLGRLKTLKDSDLLGTPHLDVDICISGATHLFSSGLCVFSGSFFTSVEKVDYLTLRHGFITSQATFNFQKYIKRSLEEDFKVIVGISPVVWFIAVLLLLTNTNGWYSHFWLPFIPLIILLLVGAKLQLIITKMGMRILERGDVIKGSPVVQPGDDLFWFNRPGLILFLIHVVLFENAFQLAFFAWSWYEFGYPSCYHENLEDLIIRISMGVLIQVLCSYVTLPLYALVTQMGSNLKPVIFSEPVASALRKWHHTAKKQLKHGRQSASTTPFSSRPASPLHGSMSPVYLLQGQRNYSDHNNTIEGGYLTTSPRASNFSNEGWGGEGSSASPSHGKHQNVDENMRNSTLYQSEIERDVENPPPQTDSVRGQHEVHISLSDFSFRQKEKLSS
ncbi:mlo-like protein 6 [Phtheirospermum japonicum]|uniref:MLO-like protein n=1 Tax=Phtheirospermum japonicum TaxID=374723 RepID=A0A830CV35_9LAMI|nr:mlo-like protein 6 [Phtheirospermum japonicum]